MEKMSDGVFLVTKNGRSITKICEEDEIRELIPYATMCRYIDQVAEGLRILDETTKAETRKTIEFRGEKMEQWIIPCYNDRAIAALRALVNAYEKDITQRVGDALK